MGIWGRVRHKVGSWLRLGQHTPLFSYASFISRMDCRGASVLACAGGIRLTGTDRLSELERADDDLKAVQVLTLGSSGPDVQAPQRFLNGCGFAVKAEAGMPGSVGYESDYFGELSRAALARFQSASGVVPAPGIWERSRKHTSMKQFGLSGRKVTPRSPKSAGNCRYFCR